jgi:hypothetical protein
MGEGGKLHSTAKYELLLDRNGHSTERPDDAAKDVSLPIVKL